MSNLAVFIQIIYKFILSLTEVRSTLNLWRKCLIQTTNLMFIIFHRKYLCTWEN